MASLQVRTMMDQSFIQERGTFTGVVGIKVQVSCKNVYLNLKLSKSPLGPSRIMTSKGVKGPGAYYW